jgi:hypothetical protein
MLAAVKNFVADRFWLGALRKHRSRMGWRDAPRYSEYLAKAQKDPLPTADVETGKRALHFEDRGWAAFSDAEATDLANSMLAKIKAEQAAAGKSIWDAEGRYATADIFLKFPEVEAFFKGKVGDFLRAVYGADFKIFFGVCYRSVHAPDGPSGSQRWHADGGPGTCINLMWCLSPVSAENGAMQCLDWSDSLKIFKGERAATREAVAQEKDRMRKRYVVSDYYRDTIAKDYKVNQPTGGAGLVFGFSNNTIHKGGFPQPGYDRYVCVFHIYPSVGPTPFDRYRASGIPKTASNPSDPGFGDAIR